MNTSNETIIATALRNWFMTPNDMHPETIFSTLDFVNIMVQLRFGNRMINEAQGEANAFEMIGSIKEAKEIDKDITIINKNLDKIKQAYNLGMN